MEEHTLTLEDSSVVAAVVVAEGADGRWGGRRGSGVPCRRSRAPLSACRLRVLGLGFGLWSVMSDVRGYVRGGFAAVLCACEVDEVGCGCALSLLGLERGVTATTTPTRYTGL
jgi:hypothetical protein